MTLVVDASVAVKWYLAEPESPRARALEGGGDRLIAPDLIMAEVLNAAWKAVRLRQFTETQLHAVAAALPRALDALVGIEVLAKRAVALAHQLDHPIYDCFYVALAEREAATLVTADRRLVARVAGTPWAASVTDLAAWTPT